MHKIGVRLRILRWRLDGTLTPGKMARNIVLQTDFVVVFMLGSSRAEKNRLAKCFGIPQ